MKIDSLLLSKREYMRKVFKLTLANNWSFPTTLKLVMKKKVIQWYKIKNNISFLCDSWSFHVWTNNIFNLKLCKQNYKKYKHCGFDFRKETCNLYNSTKDLSNVTSCHVPEDIVDILLGVILLKKNKIKCREISFIFCLLIFTKSKHEKT